MIRRLRPNLSLYFICVLSAAALVASETRHQDQGLLPFERRLYLMGTNCTLVYYGEDKPSERIRLEDFVRILESTERQLSSWRLDSSISLMNRHPVGQAFSLDRSLCQLLDTLFFWHRATDGAFDPAIGPWIEAWDLRGQGRLATREASRQARDRAGLARLYYQPSLCLLTRLTDTWLDSGAFGKGEALDRIRRHAAQAGLQRWLVDLGGQISVQGAPPGEPAWTVVLTHPERRRQPLFSIAMNSGSLATSGGATRDLRVKGVRIRHVIDPRSGRPASFNGSVSVWHESSVVADILSTALYVMGPDQGLDWAQQRDLSICFMLVENGRVRMRPSSAFSRQFSDSLEEAREPSL